VRGYRNAAGCELGTADRYGSAVKPSGQIFDAVSDALRKAHGGGDGMTELERLNQELSGCPCIIRRNGKVICSRDKTEVTGFEMCEVDWESCSDYQAAVKKANAAKAEK